MRQHLSLRMDTGWESRELDGRSKNRTLYDILRYINWTLITEQNIVLLIIHSTLKQENTPKSSVSSSSLDFHWRKIDSMEHKMKIIPKLQHFDILLTIWKQFFSSSMFSSNTPTSSVHTSLNLSKNTSVISPESSLSALTVTDCTPITFWSWFRKKNPSFNAN